MAHGHSFKPDNSNQKFRLNKIHNPDDSSSENFWTITLIRNGRNLYFSRGGTSADLLSGSPSSRTGYWRIGAGGRNGTWLLVVAHHMCASPMTRPRIMMWCNWYASYEASSSRASLRDIFAPFLLVLKCLLRTTRDLEKSEYVARCIGLVVGTDSMNDGNVR
ncbi:hypothetical protein IG631_17085 [Alternaria alternata]|nr:hypothetical protein IG631_17085 [Alternaria alternata]